MNTISQPVHVTLEEPLFLGLAPYLRMNINGTNLLQVAQHLLSLAEHDNSDANVLMNLSTTMFCLQQKALGLAIQSQALELRSVFHLAASQQPAKLRLLMLVVPGDLSANMPLDCLLENSDVDLVYYYVDSCAPLAFPVPDHDALIVAISESDENRALIVKLDQALAHWPKPVINSPRNIQNTDRNQASILLQNVQGLLMPPTVRSTRQALLDIVEGKMKLNDLFEGCDFPIILRPVGSHAGRDLEKIAHAEEIRTYMTRVADTDFFLSKFIDYSGKDGLFRKFRIALIDGNAYACHMAVSSDWMVHYVNAGMYEDASKRAEELAFMNQFDDFSRHHKVALDAIYKRSKLDYVCIDCAETREGELLIFEIDHAMVVHAMDTETLFPYKQAHMLKVKDAFRDYLFRLTNHQVVNN